ncbi:hypothetical protein [Pseudomonas gelidaquae]|uniref:hypothetical protein n=1 Tax=Pseudomonas sp. IB20 TaxID=1702250 RepID=UPI0012D2FD7A|nr:hypothetical protein [Pseudomonas sp. IB20]
MFPHVAQLLNFTQQPLQHIHPPLQGLATSSTFQKAGCALTNQLIRCGQALLHILPVAQFCLALLLQAFDLFVALVEQQLQGVTLGGYAVVIGAQNYVDSAQGLALNEAGLGYVVALYFGHSYFLAGPCPGGGVGELRCA